MADKFDLKAIISAVDKITPTLKGIQKSVKLTSKTIKDIGSAGRDLTASLGIPAGLAFASVAYGAYRAANAAMEYAGNIQDAADRTNTSVQGFQALSNLLAQVGGSAEDAEMAISTFNKGVAAAASGADKSFAGLMQKMKIPLRDAAGNLRSLEDVLPDVAEAFKANQNPALQARMSMELFGKSGKKLLPVLNGGRQAYINWIKEQQRLGLLVADDSVSALDDLGDSIGVLNLQIKAQLTQSMAALVPIIQPIIHDMSEWIAANKEWLRAEIVSTIKEMAQAIKEVDWRAIGKDINSAALAVRETVKAFGGMKNVMMAVGALILAGPVSSILSIVGAVWRFGAGLLALVGGWSAVGSAIMAVGKVFMVLTRLFLLNPIGLVITAIATAAYLVYANWDKIKGWFTEFFNWLPQQIRKIAQWFTDLVPDWVKEMFTSGPAVVNATQTPLAQSGALGLAGPQQLRGDMTVRFENAPPGMRVAPGKTNQSGVSMNPDVGYRSFALGL